MIWNKCICNYSPYCLVLIIASNCICVERQLQIKDMMLHVVLIKSVINEGINHYKAIFPQKVMLINDFFRGIDCRWISMMQGVYIYYVRLIDPHKQS